MKGCTFAIFVVFSFIQQLWDLVGHLVEGWGTAQGERHQQGALKTAEDFLHIKSLSRYSKGC